VQREGIHCSDSTQLELADPITLKCQFVLY
jgi:hypothetical protein